MIGFWIAVATLASPALPPRPAQQERSTPQPPAQKAVDYRNPPRKYRATQVLGWKVLVEDSLSLSAPDVEKQALNRLAVILRRAMAVLPASSHAELKKLTLMLMYGLEAPEGGRDNGLEFFREGAPRFNSTLDPHMSGAVVIYSARNWLFLSDFWALKALVHEFSHARQLLHWPEDQPDIYGAWRAAMRGGLYQRVKDDGGQLLEKAWATTNQLEYFAELSCMYFVGCNYYPFKREELRSYDPSGYAVVRRIWGLGSAGR